MIEDCKSKPAIKGGKTIEVTAIAKTLDASGKKVHIGFSRDCKVRLWYENGEFLRSYGYSYVVECRNEGDAIKYIYATWGDNKSFEGVNL